MKTIVIGADHAGFALKSTLIQYLTERGEYKVVDAGCYSADSVDYPDYAHQVATTVLSDLSFIGVLICGSGVGISIAANRHRGIRAALCWQPAIAALSRQHNDANVVVLPARFVSNSEAIEILDTFICTAFEGGRHQRRIDKIDC